MEDALDPLQDSQPVRGGPECTQYLCVPVALEHAPEGRYILCRGYMRLHVALEGKIELPRTGFGVGRGHRKFQDGKNPVDGNMRDACRAESTSGNALSRQLRRQARLWGEVGENTIHDENLCAHQQV